MDDSIAVLRRDAEAAARTPPASVLQALRSPQCATIVRGSRFVMSKRWPKKMCEMYEDINEVVPNHRRNMYLDISIAVLRRGAEAAARSPPA